MNYRLRQIPLFACLVIAIIWALPVSGDLTPSREHELQAGAVVNICDYQARRFLTMSGPVVLRGQTVALSWRVLEPGIETAREVTADDRITFVRRGSLEKMIGGSFLSMGENDLVYEESGAETVLSATVNSADVISFLWTGSETSKPMIPAGRIINRNYLQWCIPDNGDEMVKVVQGRRGQVCFVRLDPDAAIPEREQPGETIILVMRGGMDVTFGGKIHTLGVDDVMLIGKGSPASFTTGADGCHFAAVMSPAQQSYTLALTERIKTFHGIFPVFVRPELVVDGRFGDPRLSFIEGPNWMNGRFYFTDMSVGGVYRIEHGGSLSTLNANILPCGTALLPNGNFAVCDIKNNTVVEMTPEGKTAGTLVDSFNGGPLPGIPNDIVCDKNGGLYITAMNFSEPPGSNVLLYRSPDGAIGRITEPGDFGIPNGCVLSPDGNTLYVNDDKNRYIQAFDVMADGSIENRRNFARLILDESVLGGKRTKTFADGMTIDNEGNIYVCASGFVQIFDNKGDYRGGFVFPKPAFHLAFGGPERSTLYIACLNLIYTLKTNMRGLAQ